MDQDYFSSKLATLQSVAKKEDVLAAFEEKRATLQKFSEAQIQNQTAYDNTTAGILGLAPNEDSFQHSTVNNLARAGAAISKTVGNVVTALEEFGREGVSSHAIPQAVRDARARQLKGEASQDDLNLLALPNGMTKAPKQMTTWQADRAKAAGTNLERIQAWEKNQEELGKTREFFNIDSIVDRRADAEVANQIKDDAKQAAPDFAQAKESWNGGDYLSAVANGAKGVGKLAKSVAGAGSEDPATLLAMAAEGAVPSIVAGALFGVPGTVVTAGSYAIDAYQQAVADYRKKNNGAMPSQEWVAERSAMAASLGLAEGVSDRLTLGAGKAAKGVIEGAAKAVAGMEKGAVKSLAGMGVKMSGGAVGEAVTGAGIAAAGEYGTEAFQTVVENAMKGESTSLDDAHLGGTLGAWGGGGIALGTGVAGAALGGGQKYQDARQEAAAKIAQQEAKAAVVDQVAASGDVSALADKNSPNYSPEVALGALKKMAFGEGVTPEKRAEYTAQAKDIFNKLDVDMAALKSGLGGDAQLQADLAAAEKDLASIPASDTANRAEAQEYVDLLKQELAAGELPAEQKAARQEQIRAMEPRLQEAKSLYDALLRDDVAQLAKEVDVEQAVAEASPASVQKLRVLSMASPESLSIPQAQALVDSKAPGVTDADRDFFRAYVEAESAALQLKTMGKVSQEILYGDAKLNQKGLQQYRERFGLFTAQGNRLQAVKEMAGLVNFIDNQAGKVDAMDKAMAEFKATNKTQHVFKDENGAWQVQPVPQAKDFKRKDGEYLVSGMTAKLIQNSKVELDAMKKTMAFMQSFSQPTSSVPNASPAPVAANVPVASPAQPAAPAATPAGETAAAPASPVAGTTPAVPETVAVERVDAADSTAVEAPGVTEQPEQAAQPEVAETAKLSLFQDTDPNTETFRSGVVQSAGKANGTKRPLVVVKDFLSVLASNVKEAAQYLKSPLTTEQERAIAFLVKTAPEWSKSLQNVLRRTNDSAFYYRNPAEYLMVEVDGKLDFDANTKTAVIAAAMAWIMDAKGQGLFNKPESINSILGRESDEHVGRLEYEILGTVGVRRATAANALGKRITEALGLKPNAKLPQNLFPQLQASLGAYALSMLAERQVVEFTSVSQENWKALTGTDVGFKDQLFVRLERQTGNDKALGAHAQAVVDAMTGTSNVVEKLFSVEDGVTVPSFEPVAYEQKQVQKGRTKVPSKLAESLAKKNSEKNFIKTAMLDLVYAIEPEMFLKIMGVKAADATMHVNNRTSQEAKNDGLEREYWNAREFIEGEWAEAGYDQPIYLQHVAWKNQRVGIENTVLNPQTSKLARHLLVRESWKTQIDPSNAEQMENFRLRVLESFGVKTDKQSNAKSLTEWNAKIENDQVKLAVQAMVSLRQNPSAGLSTEQQQAIVDAVAQGGEKMRTLDALKALADLQLSEGKPFESDLVGEVDGVTNGPMLTNLLLGAADSVGKLYGLINKGGFFTAGNGFANYNVYRGSEGKLDLYETMTKSFMDRLRRMGGVEQHQDIWAFSGQMETEDAKVSKDGRNIIKRPVTALHFGSAPQKAVEGMAEDFVASVFKTLEKYHKERKDVAPLIQHLNGMLGLYGDKAIPAGTSSADLLELRFNEKQIKQLKAHFTSALGEPVQKALKTSFASVLGRKRSMNGTAGFAFGLFDVAYQATRQAVIKELVAKGEIPLNKSGAPIWDLTLEQEAQVVKRLNKLRPIMATAMSTVSGEKASGLSVSKREQQLSDQDKITVLLNKAGTANGNASMSVAPQMMVETGPGVAPFSVSIHSFDSAVSHTAAAMSEALNIHDAHVTGLGDYTQVAQNLNKSLWEMALEYSPAQAMYQSLEDTVTAMAAMLADPATTPEVRGAVKAFIQEAVTAHNEKTDKPFFGTPAEFLTLQLQKAKDTAYEADRIRLGTLAQMHHIDQYALEGGQYDVTEADRKAAADKAEALNNMVPAAVLEKVQSINALLDSAPAAQNTTPTDIFGDERETVQAVLGMSNAEANYLMVRAAQASNATPELKSMLSQVGAVMESTGSTLSEAAMQELSDSEAASLVEFLAAVQESTQSTPFGVLGTPAITPEGDVLEMLRNHPEMTAKEALFGLRALLSKRGDFPQKAFYDKLIGMAYKAIGEGDVKVKLVTPATAPSEVLAAPTSASRGWFVPANGTIYALSPEFVTSGLTAEMLIHELVHASIESLIDNPKTPEQKQAVAELKDLQAKAQAFVQANNLHQFTAAVSDVQELVAWGMTNAEFQKSVLRQLKATSKTKLQNIKDGLQAFVDSLVKLMFPLSRETDAARINGFAALVGNVTVLYQGAAKANKTKTDQGIAQVNKVLAQAWVDPNAQIEQYSSQEVFDALDGSGNSAGFTERLQGLLNEVVDSLHGPFGDIKAKAEKLVGKTALDAWANAQARGETPFNGKVLAASVVFTEQAAFVAEQVEAVMSEALNTKAAANSPIYKELEKVYAQAREALRGKIDKDLYKFVFQVNSANSGMGGKSDYMQRFVAMALTHEGFNQSLRFETRKADLVLKGKTFMERLEAIWRAAVDWASARITGTYLGQQADHRVDALVRKLVQVEAKHKDKLKGKKSILDFMQPLEEKVRQGYTGAKEKAAQAAGSRFVRENRFVLVQAAGSVVKTVAGDRVEKVMDALNAMSNKTRQGKPNEAIQLMNYIKGPGEWLNQVIRMAKHTEGERKHIIHDVAKAVMSGFKDNGAYLTANHKKAVSAVLLRTGAHLLRDKFGVNGIQEMLEDSKVLTKAIEAEIGALSSHPEVGYWIHQAEGLAWMRITGWAGAARQNLNAHNIAHLYNSGHPSPANAKAVVPNIERLIALYGLKHADTSDVNFLLEVMKTEAAKGGDNGIQMTLDLHAKFEQDSKEKLFKDSEAMAMHGYLPEVVNPNVSFSIARSDDEAKELSNLGYVLKAEVPTDKNDPDQRPVFLYVLKGGGLPRWQSGAFSTTGTKAKGTQKHGQYFNPLDSTGVANMQSMNQIFNAEQAEVDDQFNLGNRFKPEMQNRLVPVMNANGQMADYRYMMKEHMRDEALERDNSFEHLLGVMAGTTYDKVTSREQNKDLAQSLFDMYKKDFSSNPHGFTLVGAASTDPEMREIWDLLPSNTKRDIQKIWGMKGVLVPKEMVLPLFGYRKATLSSLFDKENRNRMEQGFVEFSTWLMERYGIHKKDLTAAEAKEYAQGTYLKVRQVEDVWAEIVKETKNTIVVKSVGVLWGNMTSNFSILLANGLPVTKLVSYQLEGLRAVMDYQRDRDALAQLKLRLQTSAGLVGTDELLSEQARLEDSLARNPAKELIDAGLLPSIVDDVELEDDPYSYRSTFTEWAEAKTAKLNKTVVAAAKQVYMSHDTVLYKLLNKTTQYSDFVGRYALYKHETTKKNPVAKDKALFNASESFVNYDLPMPRTLQYLDDHGFMNFIKYFFSIQRVIARLMRDKPLGVVNTIAMNNMLGDLPIFLDSAALTRIGNNPLGMGAFGYPGTLDDLATVQAVTGMFK